MTRAGPAPSSAHAHEAPFKRRSIVLIGLLFVAACAKPVDPERFQTQFPHEQDAWIAWRAHQTQTSIQDVQTQDALLSEAVPAAYGADYLALEGAALWAQQCQSCHGASGSGNPERAFDPAPRDLGSFGMTMGFRMGGDDMRMGIHRKIRTGRSKDQTQPGDMPGFGEQLSNEQIWALVQHIESL